MVGKDGEGVWNITTEDNNKQQRSPLLFKNQSAVWHLLFCLCHFSFLAPLDHSLYHPASFMHLINMLQMWYLLLRVIDPRAPTAQISWIIYYQLFPFSGQTADNRSHSMASTAHFAHYLVAINSQARRGNVKQRQYLYSKLTSATLI